LTAYGRKRRAKRLVRRLAAMTCVIGLACVALFAITQLLDSCEGIRIPGVK
jgi:hypothetical protein